MITASEEERDFSLWKQLIASPHSTWFFQLKDQTLREAYRSYNIQHESTLYPLVFSLTAFVVEPFFFGMSYVSRNNRADLALSVSMTIMDAAVVILGLVIAYIRFYIGSLQRSLDKLQSSSSSSQPIPDSGTNNSDEIGGIIKDSESAKTDTLQRSDSKINTSNPQLDDERHELERLIEKWYHYLSIVGHIYLFIFQLAVLCYAFCRNFVTICTLSHDNGEYSIHDDIDRMPWNTHGNEFRAALNVIFCGNVPEHYFPMDGMYMLTVSPIIMAVAFPSIDISLIWMQLSSSIAAVILICAIKNHLPPVTYILLWLVVNIFVVAQLQLDKIHRFYMHLQLKSLLVQNEKEAEAFHVNEMRFLIANVAHDLKTVRNAFQYYGNSLTLILFSLNQPLMSFTSAIGLIKQCTEELENEKYINVLDIHRENSVSLFDNLKECVANLSDTNAFMLMTINRCIDYAKAAKGIKLTPKLETIDLWEALQMPVKCMKNVQDKVSIELLDLPIDMTCRHIITDRQWLQENVLCLLSNAIKYTNKGKVSVKVSFLIEKTPSMTFSTFSPGADHTVSDSDVFHTVKDQRTKFLLFEIEDNGIGVPDELKPSLFQPFKQAQRLAGGTGLGLYSLSKRIESLQGEYGVRGRRDGKKGSLFWFAIPYRPDELMSLSLSLVSDVPNTATNNQFPDNTSDATADLYLQHSGIIPPRPPEHHPPRSPTGTTHKRLVSTNSSTIDLHRNSSAQLNHNVSVGELDILLVDDAPTIVKMTSMMLRKLGHRITTAENGEVAVNTVESYWKEQGKCFDVILMDLQMPVMDGLEATKRIRSMEGHSANDTTKQVLPTQLIFGVSANSDHETEEHAMKSGVNAFIGKPFTAKVFLETFNNKSLDASL